MANAVMKETRTSGGGMGAFFSKLSRGLMLPIALLPVAGLFLGVGAGFANVITQAMDGASEADIAQATFVFTTISAIGDVIFGNLPTLFCLGVAVAFAEEAGVAVFSALVGWIVFNATQSAFIWEGVEPNTFNILWYVNVPASVVGTNVGLQSMQTSVFGGITIGLFVAFLYNKFHTIEMPPVLGFFSGTRFVPIITFLTVPLIGIFFLMIWPVFGIGLNLFGASLNSMPAGTNSLVFGIIERSLIPFGLHHAFYTPLWYTSAGGQLMSVDAGGAIGTELAAGDQTVWFELQAMGIPFNIFNHLGETITSNGSEWTTTVGAATQNGVSYTLITKDGTDVAYITDGMQAGAYQQGKFSFMMFGLPAAGAAMIMAAKKENRQVAMSVIGAAAVTSFLTGITEPIEFTFLFLAPVLYYGFHVWMAGLSFWLMNLLGVHMGMTFSGGVFDFILFGILPDATGLHANCYWVVVVGLIYMPIYYFVFYFYITKKDVKTPGRDDSGEVKMVSKADYKASKAGAPANATESATAPADASPEVQEAIKAGVSPDRAERFVEIEAKLGGIDNLSAIAACITRLRITVIDPSKVDYAGIKAMGSSGVVGEGKAAQQHIFGAEADKFKGELLKLREYRKNNS